LTSLFQCQMSLKGSLFQCQMSLKGQGISNAG
jgi:hypothetical protein